MARKTAKIAAVLLLVLLLSGFGGCRVKKSKRLPPEKIPPLQTATLEELLERLEPHQEVKSINAVTELIPSTGSAYSGVIEQYHDVRAFVLAQRAAAGHDSRSREIRVIGQAPIVRKNIFDMVADDTEFRIFVPSKNKFIVGPTRLERRSDKPIENLRPQHLFEALFVALPQSEAAHLLEENEFGGQRYYAVSEIIRDARRRLTLHRKWWFERSQLELVRIQRFDAEGRLLADIRYGAWSPAQGLPYPREIELVRPQEDYRLKLIVKELTLNETLGPEKFRLEKPAAAELVRLKDEPSASRQESR